MKDTYDEIRTIGKIFGVPDRADELVTDLQTRVGKATTAVKGEPQVPVFVYDSGDKSAFTAGGKSLGTELIRLAGGENVFADLDDVFGDVSWEQVVERKPEAIAIYDYPAPEASRRRRSTCSPSPRSPTYPPSGTSGSSSCR